jgi:tryptophan halogenase
LLCGAIFKHLEYSAMSARRVSKIVVVGGGSAGFMSALLLTKALTNMQVVIVRSPRIPVIGVGESTTVSVPTFLHEMLRLDRKQFFAEVQPSWKLGIRYEWGEPGESHFNYTFDPCVDVQLRADARINAYHCLKDMRDASVFSALMDRAKAPCIITPEGQPKVAAAVGYHIENKAYVAYLERQARVAGVEIIDEDVVDLAKDEAGYVTSLKLGDGRELAGDLFIDCTGFASWLLQQQMGAKFVSYAESLFVDTAVVGSWPRTDEVIYPYTTATTMNHGWAWRIDFADHITRGYVHSSAFCTAEEAMRELQEKNPRIGEMRTIKFRTGRYDQFWINNVVAVGNSGGFVEPLEATALHMVVEHLRLVRQMLAESYGYLQPELIPLQNERCRILWDDIRDFLAIHYKFNRRLDTPFWRHCRTETNLAGAAPLVELYEAVGPTTVCDHLIPRNTVFGLNGYLSLMVGQRAPTRWNEEPTPQEWQAYEAYRHRVRQEVAHAVDVRQALAVVTHPAWRWG